MKSVFHLTRGKPHALRLEFGGKEFGLIGLPSVLQFAHGFEGKGGNARQIGASVGHFLRGQHAIESHLDCGFYPDFLLFGLDFRKLRFFGKDVASAAEFAAGDDGLFDEKSLLAAVRLAAADFIACVTDGGVGIKRGLLCMGAGSADSSFGLAVRRVVLSRRFEGMVEGEKRGIGIGLRAAQSREFQGVRYIGVFVLHLHTGHGRLLLGVDR